MEVLVRKEAHTSPLRRDTHIHTHTQTIPLRKSQWIQSSGLEQEFWVHGFGYKKHIEITEHSFICQHELNFIDRI